MQKNDNILEVARNIVALRNQLETVNELKEQAFEPCRFPNHYTLKQLDDFHNIWVKLYHFPGIRIRNFGDFESKLDLLSNAYISRREFCESPSVISACESVEKYIEEQTEEISKYETVLNTLYNRFANGTGDLSFIFKASKVKELIITNFLLS